MPRKPENYNSLSRRSANGALEQDSSDKHFGISLRDHVTAYIAFSEVGRAALLAALMATL